MAAHHYLGLPGFVGNACLGSRNGRYHGGRCMGGPRLRTDVARDGSIG
jgi:hypothetical protein